MEKSGDNKENSVSPLNSGTITQHFKVKKCLFESPQPMDVDSPNFKKATSPWLNTHKNGSTSQESPYTLFKIKKRKAQASSPLIPHAATCYDFVSTTPTQNVLTERNGNEDMYRSCDSFLDDSPNVVKIAVQKSIQNPELIGDYSKPCILPVIKGKHPDLMTIEPETVSNVLNSCNSSNYTIIDCRYPYEFDGGHIRGAVNIYYKDNIVTELLTSPMTLRRDESRNVIIFYCEFSSERAPSMFRFLRAKDREMNKDCYPFLYYPEMYLIEGGYKAFFLSFEDLCVPRGYKTMLDKDYEDDLAIYRAKCKSWSRRTKRSKSFRSVLQF